MPAYEQQGQYFRCRYIPRSVNLDLHGVVTVDAMVNADGTVHDTELFESSGNPEIDQIAEGMVQSAVYSLHLNPGDPAPHVVRRQIVANNYQERYRAGPGVDTAINKLRDPLPNFETRPRRPPIPPAARTPAPATQAPVARAAPVPAASAPPRKRFSSPVIARSSANAGRRSNPAKIPLDRHGRPSRPRDDKQVLKWTLRPFAIRVFGL